MGFVVVGVGLVDFFFLCCGSGGGSGCGCVIVVDILIYCNGYIIIL